MPKTKLILFVLTSLSLAACGGSESSKQYSINTAQPTAPDKQKPAAPSKPSSANTNKAKPTAVGYNQMIASLRDFETKNIDPDRLLKYRTEVAQMPTTGTATYAGVGFVDIGNTALPPTARIIGTSKVTADFGKKTVAAQVSNFKSAPGTLTSGGNLRANGSINGNLIAGNVTGEVNINGRDHRIDIPAAGTFFQKNADAVLLGGKGRTSDFSNYQVSITGTKTK